MAGSYLPAMAVSSYLVNPAGPNTARRWANSAHRRGISYREHRTSATRERLKGSAQLEAATPIARFTAAIQLGIMRAVKSLAKGNSKQLYSGPAAQRRRPGFSFRVTLAHSVRSHSEKYFVCFYIALTQY
jgi:hypothetical protein